MPNLELSPIQKQLLVYLVQQVTLLLQAVLLLPLAPPVLPAILVIAVLLVQLALTKQQQAQLHVKFVL